MSNQSELSIPEEQLKQALLANRGRHFPPHLRRAAVAYWKDARQRGISRYRISQALGMNLTTLVRWAGNSGSPGGTAALRPVQVVEAPPMADASRIVVHTSSGLRIEGLDIQGLAELLKACR